MTETAWSRDLAIGDAELDDQHRLSVACLNTMHATLRQPVFEPDVFGACFAKLVSFTEEHFVTEEAFMQSVDAPSLAFHRSEHERIVRRMVFLGGKFAADTCHDTATELALESRALLIGHTREFDRMLRVHCRPGLQS